MTVKTEAETQAIESLKDGLSIAYAQGAAAAMQQSINILDELQKQLEVLKKEFAKNQKEMQDNAKRIQDERRKGKAAND